MLVGKSVPVGIIPRSAGEIPEHAVLEPVHDSVRIGVRALLEVMSLVSGCCLDDARYLCEGAPVRPGYPDIVDCPVPEGITVGGESGGEARVVGPLLDCIGLGKKAGRFGELDDLEDGTEGGKGQGEGNQPSKRTDGSHRTFSSLGFHRFRFPIRSTS